MKKRFWNFKEHRIRDETGERIERVLELNGVIAEESWWGDEVTPQIFKDDLNSVDGDITVYINSPGGDCIAAAQIYNMLTEYPHNVTVKIDGLAASAASVVAMAGDTVLMSPVSMLMAHNPSTIAFGDSAEMERAIGMLNEVKESIINAYERKTGLPRAELSKLMDAETWMNANKALELGFCDDIMERTKPNEGNSVDDMVMYSQRTFDRVLLNKIEAQFKKERQDPEKEEQPSEPEPENTEPKKEIPGKEEKPSKPEPEKPDSDEEEQEEKPKVATGRSAKEILDRLDIIKHFI